MAFILVIDDKENIRTAIAMVLEDLSHAVELAEYGQKGVELLNRLKDFDLVIPDFNTPNKGGNEVPRYLKNLHRSSIPVLAITAYPEEAEIELFDCMIMKPFMLEKLRETVARFTNCSSPKRMSFR
jgi:CheY-like chemotaxis protein